MPTSPPSDDDADDSDHEHPDDEAIPRAAPALPVPLPGPPALLVPLPTTRPSAVPAPSTAPERLGRPSSRTPAVTATAEGRPPWRDGHHDEHREHRNPTRPAADERPLVTDGGRPVDGDPDGDGARADERDGGDPGGATGRVDDLDARDLAAYAAVVRESLTSAARAAFDRRARLEAARIADDCEAGRLDNRDFAVGLELEAPVVDADGRPVPVPGELLEAPGYSPELAVHDVEVHTDPDVLSGDGLRRQRDALRERVAALRSALGPDREFVLDAMWAVPPAEGSRSYFGGYDEHEGFRFARRMTPNGRYYAIDNDILGRTGGSIPVDLPGVDAVPSILFEATATSIQPHLQVPDAASIPAYLAVASRTMAPVLALAVNSPFLPADCYAESGGDDDGGERPAVDVETAFAAPQELRIPVFERTVNAGLASGDEKCRVPADVATAREAFGRIAGDVAVAPTPVSDSAAATDGESAASESAGGGDSADTGNDGETVPYGDRFPTFRAKRGTFWRWVRPVVGGDVAAGPDGPAPGNDDASVRVEYRPIPTQPTVDDVVGFQALVSGLVRGLVEADHPITELPWSAARGSFYRVVDDGIDADVQWVTADGDPTDDRSRLYGELFAYARRGLESSGVAADVADELLAPLEARWEARETPAGWKRRRVRDRLDRGASLPEAIADTYREYAELAREHDRFVDWL
jgi:hypothetical protein